MAQKEQSIYELIRQLEQAWNKGDSRKFAAPFAEDADFINILGKHYTGRSTIEAGHREIFDTIYKGSHCRYAIEGVRFLREDVALAFVHAVLELANGKTMNARPTLVLTKNQQKWQIGALQNTTISDARPL